jgi:hypothetical protein
MEDKFCEIDFIKIVKEGVIEMLSFSMQDINTLNEVKYIIKVDCVEVVCDGVIISKVPKQGNNDNQIAQDLINNLIQQGYIISEFNLIK